MSDINKLVLLDEGWGKALALGGLAALAGGAVASQTHTGKAIYHNMMGNKIKAAAHGLQSPLLRKRTATEIGKVIGKTAVAGGLAYGAKKAYDYSKTPEGQAKVNDLKNKATDTVNKVKNTVKGWFGNNNENNK